MASKQVSKQSKPITCPICSEDVVDGSGRKKGHESIFCDGRCQEWIHRQCAGLSKIAFRAASNSEDPFHCPSCIILQQSQHISELKESIIALARDVKALQVKVADISSTSSHATNPVSGTLSPVTLPSPTVVNNSHPTSRTKNSVPKSTSKPIKDQDRKYNLVVFGVPEMPSGSSRSSRANHDFSKLSAIISDLEHASDHKSSIRDCRRLGKYVHSENSSRPLLVTLNSTADVRNILHHHNNSSDTSITIKPDLPAAIRKGNAILLKERWSLINSGIDRKSIRIHGQELFVNGQVHGKISGSVFVLTPSSSKPLEDSLPSIPASNVPPFSATVRSSVTASPRSTPNNATPTITLDSVNPPTTRNESSRPTSVLIPPPSSSASSD